MNLLNSDPAGFIQLSSALAMGASVGRSYPGIMLPRTLALTLPHVGCGVRSCGLRIGTAVLLRGTAKMFLPLYAS